MHAMLNLKWSYKLTVRANPLEYSTFRRREERVQLSIPMEKRNKGLGVKR